MNIKILAQNIVNNPSDFTAEQVEKYFEDYAKLRLSAVSGRSELLKCDGCFKPIKEETCYCEDCYIKHGELQ